jgi:hypothetical protein
MAFFFQMRFSTSSYYFCEFAEKITSPVVGFGLVSDSCFACGKQSE